MAPHLRGGSQVKEPKRSEERDLGLPSTTPLPRRLAVMLSDAEGIIHDAHALASLMKQPREEELPSQYKTAMHRRRPLGRVIWMLLEVDEIARDAHALAVAIRKEHAAVPGDEINRLQREALDDAVSATAGLKQETIETLQRVVGIPPALFAYDAAAKESSGPAEGQGD